MIQQAKVVRIIDEKTAEISVIRESACGHDCESCGGCGMSAAEEIFAEAINELGARVGDCVDVETDTTAVIGIAAVVYLLPLLLFFAIYIIFRILKLNDAVCLLCGGVGFAIGVLCALALNRIVGKKNSIPLKIVSVNSGVK